MPLFRLGVRRYIDSVSRLEWGPIAVMARAARRREPREGAAGDQERSARRGSGSRRRLGPRAGGRRGTGEGRRSVAELQRHRPMPGKARLGSHTAPVHAGMDACGVVDAAGRGCEAWLGKRVVAITKMAL